MRIHSCNVMRKMRCDEQQKIKQNAAKMFTTKTFGTTNYARITTTMIMIELGLGHPLDGEDKGAAQT